jgi:hypothetical protein
VDIGQIRYKATLVVLVVLATLLAGRGDVGRVRAFPLAGPTPGPGAMTVYAVSNPNSSALGVIHVFSNSSGFSYTLLSEVPGRSTATYHVSRIPQVPSPFTGSVFLFAGLPFTARIVGYDYPTSAGYLSPRLFLPVVAHNSTTK